MRVLHLATQDVGGGAYNAAYRLHCHMQKAGEDSVMVVLTKKSADPKVIEISEYFVWWDWVRWAWGSFLARYFRYRCGSPKYFRVEKGAFFPVERILKVLPFRPDIIVAHWVSYFFTTRMMRRLSESASAPLYWYMMDMAPLTGGCHYAFGCEGYKESCGHCPQLNSGKAELDISRLQLKNKCRDLRGADITPIAPSSWLMHQTKASALFRGRPVKQIMLGVDIDVFKPVPQTEARRTLGLPMDKKIVFFGAQDVREERKGIMLLIEALNLLYQMASADCSLRDSVFIVTAGADESGAGLDIPFEHAHLGFLNGDERLAAAYQAADIYVNASIEDSGPMMINEAILCGTPVVAFDMGVASDLVHTSQTGYRVRLGDSQDMAKGLWTLLEMDAANTKAMRASCRNLGLQLCHPEVQVRAFRELSA